MAEKTNIAWTDHTFNPWMGCVKVSDGCANCYAERLTRDRMGLSLWGKDGTRQVTKAPWSNVRKWNKEAVAAGVRRRVFCASLCDVFEDHPVANETRPRLWDLVRQCPGLDWLLLTKRPENIRRMWPAWGCPDAGVPGTLGKRLFLRNVWLGTTIESQDQIGRWEELAKCSDLASKLFVSAEPLLGPLDVMSLSHGDRRPDWIIFGGESRPCDLEWIRSGVQQCRELGIACFVKQLGSHAWDISRHSFRVREDDIRTIIAPGGRKFAASIYPCGAWLTWDAGGNERETGSEKTLISATEAAYQAVIRQKHHRLPLRDKAGADPSEWPPELRVREFPAVHSATEPTNGK
jgi:protein gp37